MIALPDMEYLIVSLSKEKDEFKVHTTHFSFLPNTTRKACTIQIYRDYTHPTNTLFTTIPVEMVSTLAEAKRWSPFVTVPGDIVRVIQEMGEDENNAVLWLKVSYH